MRNERYKDLMPTEKMIETSVSVIGVGAIGRQVALQIAAMGILHVQLVDDDIVEEANLGTQAYLDADLGRSKVEATAALLRQLNPAIQVEARVERFAKSQPVRHVVFCCVDSITTRRHIFEAVHRRCGLFIDGRMAAEVLRVLTVSDAVGAAQYRQSLFSASEAHRDGCTARSTIYCANVAAGFMVGQLAKWLRGLPTEEDVSLNLLGMELAVS